MRLTTRGTTLLLILTQVVAQSIAAGSDPEIPFWTEALAKARDPTDEPFLATYRAGTKVLGFVAAHHVFTEDNSTTSAIRRAFDDINPTAVIIEGYATDAGVNPEDILESIQLRQKPGAEGFDKSEAVFAASLALSRKVPFIGGEMSTSAQIDRLVAMGHSRNDALFALHLSILGQSRRSGEMPLGDAAAFTKAFDSASRAVAFMTQGEPLAETRFRTDFNRIVGGDPVNDRSLDLRANPGASTPLQRMSADSMRVRDEHLLLTIAQQLATSDRVLVVYGRGHWTTLSAALANRYGAPVNKVSK